MEGLRSVAPGLCLIAALVPGSVYAQESGLDSINRYLAAEMKRQQIPGMSVAILRGDRVVLGRGYGFSNLELGVPASDSTIYQSGSVGKQFTAAAVLLLVQQGRLSLDDPIVKWLPEGAGVWDSVRVRHLLSHTSGVREYTDSTFDYRKDYTEDQMVRFAASRPLDFSPGERWSYSNTGYMLLGVLVHRVTGKFYGEILRQMIFAPLAMRTARIISEAGIVPNRAAGYQLLNGHLENQDWVAPTLNTTADGSLYFSINDLTRWAVALNHDSIPGLALRAAWTPVRLNDGGLYPYGFGWDLTGQRGHQRIGHTGAWQGFKTAIYRYPEYRLTVIVLANLAEAEPGAIAAGLAGMVEPDLRPPERLPAALSGPTPPTPVNQVLGLISAGKDSVVATSGLHRFLSEAARAELRDQLGTVSSWTGLGCDDVAGQGIVWLGAAIRRVCYARGKGFDGPAVASLFYSADWRVAHVDIRGY